MSKFDIVVPVGGHLVSVMGLARMAVIVIVCFRLIQSVHSWKLLAGSLAQDLLLAAFVLACIYLVALGFTLLTIWLSLVVHRFREYSPRFAWVLALFLTAVGLPLLVGYGWLAVNLASMVNGYRTFVSAGLATWNVPLPVVTVLPSVRAQIGDSVLIAVAIGLAVFGVFLGREVVLSWKRSVRLLGPRAALRSIGMMARILYRQPLRYLYFNAPGFIPLVVFALILLVTWRADSAAAQHLASSVVPVTIAGLVILISTLISLVTMTPPVIAWLSVSGVEEFRTMKNVQKICPSRVKTLIDQASQEIEPYYWDYYHQRLTHSGGFWSRFGPAFLNPRAPRTESVRTRPGLWQRTVRNLTDIAPIVVVDTRRVSEPVMQEILWMLAPERVHKAIFIVDDQRLGANLNRGLKQAGDESRSEVLACNEKTLYDLLPNMTRSPQDLPAPGKDHWRKKVNETMTALDNLMFLIRTETTTDAALDGAIHVWEQSHPADTGSPSNNIRYSASFDTALALIKRRLPEATVALFVYTSGNAEVEIDVPDRGSDWMVYSSRETPRLVLNPTRATLLAWAKAEQGWRKEPESPADTGTQDEEARWRERSIQIARTDPK